MTEFAITLPVWILVFYGLWDMAHFPVTGTRVQITANSNMWEKQLDPANYEFLETYSNPITAGIDAASVSEGAPQRTKFTGRHNVTQAEGAAHALSLGGVGVAIQGGFSGTLQGSPTLTESGYRHLMTAGAGGPDTVLKASELTGEDQRYPLYIMDDNSTDLRSFEGGDGISSKIAAFAGALLSQSGSSLAIVAGARYGAVHGEHKEEYKGATSMYSLAGVEPSSVYDSLVAPRPLQDNNADMTPWVIARLVAEGSQQYSVALRFGESEWSDADMSGVFDEALEGLDKEDEIEEDSENQERVNRCNNAGYTIPVPPPGSESDDSTAGVLEAAIARCERCLSGSNCSGDSCNAGDCPPPPPPAPPNP